MENPRPSVCLTSQTKKRNVLLSEVGKLVKQPVSRPEAVTEALEAHDEANEDEDSDFILRFVIV